MGIIYVIGSEKMYCKDKNMFLFKCGYHKMAYVQYLALCFVLIELSEVKLHLFFESLLCGGEVEKITSEIKIPFNQINVQSSYVIRVMKLGNNFITVHCIRTLYISSSYGDLLFM